MPRVYLDSKRAFGGALNDATQRLAYYRGVIAAAERDAIPVGRPVHEPSACSPCSSFWTCEEIC